VNIIKAPRKQTFTEQIDPLNKEVYLLKLT